MFVLGEHRKAGPKEILNRLILYPPPARGRYIFLAIADAFQAQPSEDTLSDDFNIFRADPPLPSVGEFYVVPLSDLIQYRDNRSFMQDEEIC